MRNFIFRRLSPFIRSLKNVENNTDKEKQKGTREGNYPAIIAIKTDEQSTSKENHEPPLFLRAPRDTKVQATNDPASNENADHGDENHERLP
jgi:hypothetical protein